MSDLVKATASLRDSWAALLQRSFDDLPLFDQVARRQFRVGEAAKALAVAMAGGAREPEDPDVTFLLLRASGEAAVARPAQPATVLAAIVAFDEAVGRLEGLLGRPPLV